MKINLFSCLILLTLSFFSCNSFTKKQKINRYELVTRHNVYITEINPLNSLTVGNGELAYTLDITGMQSYPEFYKSGIPLGTQSQWGWHSFPNPTNYNMNDVYKNYWDGNDSVPYLYQYNSHLKSRKTEASNWLRGNPHRLHLGLVGLEIRKTDSSLCKITDIQNPLQELNLWKGEIKSYFEIEGVPVKTITYCHQDLDMIAIKIYSKLLVSNQIHIKIQFPYSTHDKFSTGYDFSKPGKHETEIIKHNSSTVVFNSTLDDSSYYTTITWKENAELINTHKHEYYIDPLPGDTTFEVCIYFSKKMDDQRLPNFKKTQLNNEKRWEEFWEKGGAVDFSSCRDERAIELERRVILSQYLTKIQCTGSLPPQETGLTYNSWHGKFHLEMLWWHSMHFILWQRADLMEQQLDYYFSIYNKARNTAQIQGYKGVRWPKMVGPNGRESPSTIGTFLIWQQPHIIYFAEQLYYYNKSEAVLEKYKELVFASADFMASYARFDSAKNRYILGPALIPAQECFAPETTINPAFELTYWYWALNTAQKWRKRLGFQQDDNWQLIMNKLSDLPVKDSLYLFSENAIDSYTNSKYLKDHPMVLGSLGFLPKTKKINFKIMENTLNEIINNWDWKSTWGWDYPLAAMNATLLNKPELAIELLLMDTPKNKYLLNGHNYQDKNLTIYLPGNGGLLTAVAMMCTYTNEHDKNGFPDNGKWNIKFENLNSLH